MTLPAHFIVPAETGQRARVEPARPADARPHRFEDGRCSSCGMRETWAGARYACSGYRGRHDR